MLDWFSRNRLSGERREDVKRPGQQQILRDYVFRTPQGRPLCLSQIGLPLIIVILPSEFATRQTYFLEWLRKKSAEVRCQQTRFLVVVPPEDLYAVAALAPDLSLVTDETGEANRDLGSDESPMTYEIGRERQVLGVIEQRELAV